tara:strand:+ start:788 stop:1906 length:1119 start_codon:yes stop_codon:yes gene_type:complete
MIDSTLFLEELLNTGLNHFSGVPDSTFKSFMSLLEVDDDRFSNRIASNEGAAIAHASGYYLATNKISVVYFQNSGLGNAVNPLTSLADNEVYGIPMIILMGWRGHPDIKDEPQHKKMGAVSTKVLDALGIPYQILVEENYIQQIQEAKLISQKNLEPYVLIIKPNLFEDNKSIRIKNSSIGVIREKAIEIIVNSIPSNSIIVSTTGKTSRELYEISSNNVRGHANNFYNVGSMGHASAIGLDIAIHENNEVFVLDGDGAMIMHMGTLATIGDSCPNNLTHIIFDNCAHESTGAQPTVSGTINIPLLLEACGYKKVNYVKSLSNLKATLSEKNNVLSGIVVETQTGSRKDLGRPDDSPKKTKLRFMEKNTNEA